MSVTLVYCDQTVGWIKMKLGMQVGLGPGHIVLDGDPPPLPQRDTAPNCRPISGNSTDNDSLDSGGGTPGPWSGDKWRTPLKLKVLIAHLKKAQRQSKAASSPAPRGISAPLNLHPVYRQLENHMQNAAK